jgi:glucokinase
MSEPVLLCDFGGTHARLGILKDGNILHKEKFKCADFDNHADLFAAYQEKQGFQFSRIALAAALGAHINQTYPSGFRKNSKLSSAYLTSCGFSETYILNDFEAVAYGVIDYNFSPEGTLHAGNPDSSENVKCIVGPGTGIGFAFLHALPDRAYVQTIPNGGHVYPCAVSAEQHDILLSLQSKLDRALIYEDVACGRGFCQLYKFFTGRELDHPDKIIQSPEEPVHQDILRLFHEFLGLLLVHLVTTGNAFGGVVLNGGMIDYLSGAGLFNFKTVHHMMLQNFTPNILQQLKDTPVYYINDTYLALYGLKYIVEREQ